MIMTVRMRIRMKMKMRMRIKVRMRMRMRVGMRVRMRMRVRVRIRMRMKIKIFFSELNIKMSYYWFNRQEILEKAKKRYSKEKAAECYLENKEVIKKGKKSL